MYGALFFTVVLLPIIAYFLMGGLPLLVLKHDVPLEPGSYEASSMRTTQLPQPLPAGEAWYIPDGDAAPANFKNFAYVAGSDGSTCRAAPFQSALTQSQTVPLNAVEKWTAYNRNADPHPFHIHIHINDICVVRINGEPVEPFWADTIPLPPNANITFRSRVTAFTGAFVWHCHALDHEDVGMMQLVEVV